LPGIDKHVVHDTTLAAKQTFDDETAGFSDHPALPLAVDSVPEVQLTDSETDVGAVDDEDTSLWPKGSW